MLYDVAIIFDNAFSAFDVSEIAQVGRPVDIFHCSSKPWPARTLRIFAIKIDEFGRLKWTEIYDISPGPLIGR